MINEINEDLKFAMKKKQATMVTVLRGLKSVIEMASGQADNKRISGMVAKKLS